MPRPMDHYTHDQFEPTPNTNPSDGVVRCKHCQQWGGKNRPLQLKKLHLSECAAYAVWRAAGNGQDMAPPNTYYRRSNGSGLDDSGVQDSSPVAERGYGATPTSTQRPRPADLTQYFDESYDDDSAHKGVRARCKYCGTQRAKNVTRQWEHLQQCNDFLNSTDGQQALSNGSFIAFDPTAADIANGGPAAVTKPYRFNPGPNPNFQQAPQKAIRAAKGPKKAGAARIPAVRNPSLINYLITKHDQLLTTATQSPFLTHAGHSTLPASTISTFLAQESHLSRAVPSFIGRLIGKLRLPAVADPQSNTSWRAFDLLASTLNNAKRELEFLRTTALKHRITLPDTPASHATKGLIDLLESASSPSAGLLEGMIVLCTLEHLHLVSWHHAQKSQRERPAPPPLQPAPPTSYSLPTYYQSPYIQNQPCAGGAPPAPDDAAAALREALIPNWTSPGFAQFVDACKAIVDELAIAQTSGSGARELAETEAVFGQVVWLWGTMWPEVEEAGKKGDERGKRKDDAIEVDDGEEMETAENGDEGEEVENEDDVSLSG